MSAEITTETGRCLRIFSSYEQLPYIMLLLLIEKCGILVGSKLHDLVVCS